MVETVKEPASPKVYPIELQEILTRATAGDSSVLPQLRKAFDEHLEVIGTKTLLS